MKRQISHRIPIVILALSPFVMIALAVCSIFYGSKPISLSTIWDAFVRFDPNHIDHQIVIHSRLPRAIGALLVGAFLAISGALMQGVTRNYLASPSILGVTDGSAFAITLSMILLPNASSMEMILFSLLGSALGVAFVYGIASIIPGGLSPVKLAIFGTVVGTFLSSVSMALSTYFQISQDISFWYNARLHQVNPEHVKLAIPFAIVGIVFAMLVASKISVMALGEEVARGLGQRTKLVRGIATISVIILTGISVALVGKIGFIGLMIPHITRFLVGMDYRWVVPCAGVIGAMFLAFCDIISRFLNMPFETPIGVVTALFGVPFFLYLIRTRGGGKHA
ncbi:iron ABC transporter permease [Paenibacillus sp. SC116]|uniref:FecCD family ABC transporter permease n=1 Tax=Paenibacillus sp. SC116 TaxID=2968986 RepID=UPI00215AB84F|nr:iron ABC transporter permease [Paenibacillus sp. SC116]MCR8844192.1 iron ABC transporter permease [Paenibacillus sp. SC116]